MKPFIPGWLYIVYICVWIMLEYTAAQNRHMPIVIMIGIAVCGMLVGGMVIAQTMIYIVIVWKSLAPLKIPTPQPSVKTPLHYYAPTILPPAKTQPPSGIMFRGGVLATGMIYQTKTYADGRIITVYIEANVDTHLSMVTYELTVDITPNLAPYYRVSASTQLDAKTLHQYVKNEFRRKVAQSMSNLSLQTMTLADTRKEIMYAISVL